MTLARSSRGTDVKDIQQKLKDLSYNPGAIDGIFGSKTECVVLKFQNDFDLPITGRVDEQTLRALNMLQLHKSEKGVKLSEHFDESEFACHGDGMVKINPRLVNKLEQLRKLTSAAISITSGYRSPAYNKKVGGAPKSQHLLGNGADIKVKGFNPQQVAKLAEKIGFGGIGIYDSWVHVDVREGKARWDLRGKKGE